MRIPGSLVPYLASFRVIREESTDSGITPERNAGGRFWPATILHGLAFAGVAALPTWDGAAAIYCGAIVGVVFTWLVGSAQASRVLRELDLSPFVTRLPTLWTQFLMHRRDLGRPVPDAVLQDLSMPDHAREGLPSVATAITKFGVMQLVVLITTRAAGVLVIAILGLLVGPLMERVHWGYWSPVSLIYAYTFPYVATMVCALTAGIVASAYLSILRLTVTIDEWTEGAQSGASDKPDAVSGSEPSAS